jgi:hemerythrin-like metal-binding protein
VKWNAEYETGVAEIDGQHKDIVQLVSEFEATAKAQASWRDLHPPIMRAKECAKFHLSVEESLMQASRYPRFSAHRSEHHFVLKTFAELESRMPKTGINDELIKGFRRWLIDHFLDSDRHFVEFLRKADMHVKDQATNAFMAHALIVENHVENRNLLKLLLNANQYRVTDAGNGLEALVTARSDPPDVIVSNVLMPNMDGFDLCRAWMQDPALRAIPFIFYSDQYVRPDQEQFAMALGAVRYLIKPVGAEVLLRELRSVLQAAVRDESVA